MEHYLTFRTKSGQFGPSDDLFRGQKAGFVTIGAPKMDDFAYKMAFWGPPEGPQTLHTGPTGQALQGRHLKEISGPLGPF